jgi:Histidine kinase-, DNA gyrase B-, and HSP90-like ATPase
MGASNAVGDDVPITGSLTLAPEPRSLEALGRNHTLEAAVAELVDNSIDAGAGHVLIRFVREGPRLVRLLIVDDGAGMNEAAINVAMTVGGERSYSPDEIGRFGLGLKSASFSQASSVTVVSKARGHGPVGKRWRIEQAKRDFGCEIVESGFAAAQLRRDWNLPGASTGTIVRWDDVKGFPVIHGDGTVDRFLQDAMARIRTHLGLIFHRTLEETDVQVFIDVEDDGEQLIRQTVAALNPFGYTRSGAPRWPKKLKVGDDPTLTLTCHIWPGRSTAEQFTLDGKPIERQGLYVYYRDRLVQRGGWNGLTNPDKQLNLARVALDIDGDVRGMLYLKPEKNGIEVGPEFGPAVEAAVAPGGIHFADYLARARGVVKESNRRNRGRSPVMPPGSGIPAKVRTALSREVTFRDVEAIPVLWANFEGDDFFEIDREQGVLWLNRRYRQAMLEQRRASVNDIPLVKILMFLLMEHIFAGQNMGPRDKDNVEMWQAILRAAAKETAA